MEVKSNSYVNIHAFMVNELHLSGNALLIYSVIYGFSQDGKSWFTGSRSYLAAHRETRACEGRCAARGLQDGTGYPNYRYGKIIRET